MEFITFYSRNIFGYTSTLSVYLTIMYALRLSGLFSVKSRDYVTKSV